ncbi:MAG: hypothetical protein WCT03_12080 [Candidatus Obscuribacterales bacterium]|jgi:hypothetical protein
MQTPDKNEKDLLQVLIAAQIISQAQAQLAQSDSENMSMTIDEVLLARGWLDAPTLRKHAPWLFGKKESDVENAETNIAMRKSGPLQITDTQGSSDDYGTNLARYRALMRDILD